MGYGTPTQEQIETLASYVRGKVVHDLGAGDLQMAHILIKLGAEKVIAIDHKLPIQMECHPRVLAVYTDFSAYASYAEKAKEPIDIAFVSWPQNIPNPGLIKLIERARTIIYIGKTTDGTMCGDPTFFWTLLSRTVLKYVPHEWNVLTIYGDECALRKKLTGDELGGITQCSGRILSYEKSEAQ